jgi:hypothetical protein
MAADLLRVEKAVEQAKVDERTDRQVAARHGNGVVDLHERRRLG